MKRGLGRFCGLLSLDPDTQCGALLQCFFASVCCNLIEEKIVPCIITDTGKQTNEKQLANASLPEIPSGS